jgi:tetratricopeptide (TPR) repeat protein
LSLETRRAKLEDPGAELLDRVSGFWGSYGRNALIALGVLAAIAVGVFYTLRGHAASEAQAGGKLAEANLVFWQGDYARSQQLAKQVYEQYGSTPSGLDAHRIAGDDAFWQGNFPEAITQYRAYLDKQKTGLISDAVRRSLAYALESNASGLERDQKHAEALRALEEARQLYTGLVGVFDRESSAEFLMAASRCSRFMNKPQDAVKPLQRLLDEFGETTYANRARMELAGNTTAGH